MLNVSTTAVAGGTNLTTTYTYDGVGNRLSMADATGTATYQYDWNNRLWKVTFPSNRVVSYTYDAAGRRATMVYPFGSGTKTVTYGYDAANRVTSVADWNSTTTSYPENPGVSRSARG